MNDILDEIKAEIRPSKEDWDLFHGQRNVRQTPKVGQNAVAKFVPIDAKIEKTRKKKVQITEQVPHVIKSVGGRQSTNGFSITFEDIEGQYYSDFFRIT